MRSTNYLTHLRLRGTSNRSCPAAGRAAANTAAKSVPFKLFSGREAEKPTLVPWGNEIEYQLGSEYNGLSLPVMVYE